MKKLSFKKVKWGMHFLMAVALIAPSVTSTAYAVETTSQQSSEAVTSTTDSSRKQEPVITQETTDIKQEAPNQATSDSVKQSQETTAPTETTNLETSTAEKEETSTPQKITILVRQMFMVNYGIGLMKMIKNYQLVCPK